MEAAIAERFNRTLKSRMFKYFTQNETRRWIDIIQQLVNGYNNTNHSTIKMSPIDASDKQNTEVVWWNTYGFLGRKTIKEVMKEFLVPKFLLLEKQLQKFL